MNLEQKKLLETMETSLKNGEVEKYAEAFTQYHESLEASIKKDYQEYLETNDARILQNRGVRQLTSTEKKFYQKLIDASKSTNYKQEIDNIDVALPETVITDVYKELVQEHPLLNEINFTYISVATKWIVQDHSKQSAAWGALNSAITKEIESAFKEMDVSMHKLTAFFLLSIDMIDLGPEWIDTYVRTVLYDSLANGLEAAIVDGTGKDMPIGLARDVSEDVSVSGGEYPRKAAIKLKSFNPKEYGALLAKNGQNRTRKYEKI